MNVKNFLNLKKFDTLEDCLSYSIETENIEDIHECINLGVNINDHIMIEFDEENLMNELDNIAYLQVEQDIANIRNNIENGYEFDDFVISDENIPENSELDSYRKYLKYLSMYNALHYVTGKGFIDLIELFLENGADPNYKTLLYNELHKTPLHIAAEQGCSCVLETLLEYNASPQIEDSEGMTPIFYSLENKRIFPKLLKLSNVHHRDKYGNTLLHYAKNIKIIRELLKTGLDINAINNEGLTPIMENYKDIDTLKTFLKFNPDLDKFDKNGNTLLHYCARDKLTEHSLLIYKNSDVYIKNNENLTFYDIIRSTKQYGLMYNINLPIPYNIKNEPVYCNICRENKEKHIKLSCSHKFCPNCILDWLQIDKLCPICRQCVLE